MANQTSGKDGKGREMRCSFCGRSQNEVEQLLITGGGSICPGLAEEVANATGIGARCVHPVSSIQPGSKINAASFEADAPRLTSAFGLALRGLL